ncbi:MAG: hypothetical protein LUG96_12525 [Tannerellaceae bacterium]|nr:hypothetical protein [Tannerellaceae bacterium]
MQTSRTLKYLSAEEFNTVIGNQEEDEGVALVFEEDMSVNPFTGKKVFAETAAIYNPYGSVSTSDNDAYLYLRTEDNLFLMVDTANYNKPNETRYLRYTWVDFTKDAREAGYTTDEDIVNYSVTRLNIDPYRGHYMFRFEYEPTPNNLKINVAGLIYANVITNLQGNEVFAYWPIDKNDTRTAIENYLAANSSLDFPTGYSVYDIEVYVYKQSYDGSSQLTVASIDL